MSQNVETFGISFHQPIFDSVVDHFYEMAGAHRAAMKVATFGCSSWRTPFGRWNVRCAWREGGEYRIEVQHRRVFAADHHAVTPFESPYSAARSDVEEMNALLPKHLCPPDIVPVVRVPPVNDDISGGQKRRSFDNRAFRDLSGGQHEPNCAGRLQQIDQLAEIPTAEIGRAS